MKERIKSIVVKEPVRPGSDACICLWPKECDGDTVQHCTGCGGNSGCVCKCGGIRACPGCEICEDDGRFVPSDDEVSE